MTKKITKYNQEKNSSLKHSQYLDEMLYQLQNDALPEDLRALR